MARIEMCSEFESYRDSRPSPPQVSHLGRNLWNQWIHYRMLTIFMNSIKSLNLSRLWQPLNTFAYYCRLHRQRGFFIVWFSLQKTSAFLFIAGVYAVNSKHPFTHFSFFFAFDPAKLCKKKNFTIQSFDNWYYVPCVAIKTVNHVIMW